MSDALISSLDCGGGSFLLSVGVGYNIDSVETNCDNRDYAYSNGGLNQNMGVIGGAGECAERLHTLAILGSNDDAHSPTDSSSPTLSNKARPSGQRTKARPYKPSTPGVSSASASRGIIQCGICSKTFNNSSALAKHKLIHSDERKYACNLCSKAFKRQDHLNGHMMTHYSKKPYECKFAGCDKSYCDARSLRRHLENHHQQLMAETGSLTNSDSGTLTPASAPPDGSARSVFNFDLPFLQASQNPGSPNTSGTHTVADGQSPGGTWPIGFNPFDEPKPVKCTVCDRRFRNLPALNGHMRLHGGYMKKDCVEPVKKAEDAPNDSSGSSMVLQSKAPKRSSSSSHIYLTAPAASGTDPPLPGLAIVKSEADGLVGMSTNTFAAYDEPAASNMTTKLQLSGSHCNMFDHDWLDHKQPSDDCGHSPVKVEVSSEPIISTQTSASCQPSHVLNLPRFVSSGDPFFGSALPLETTRSCPSGLSLVEVASSQQTETDSNCIDMLSADVSNDTLKDQQQILMDDSLPDFGFPLDQPSLITSHSMPVLSGFHPGGSDVKSPNSGCVTSNLFTNKNCSVNNYSGGCSTGSLPALGVPADHSNAEADHGQTASFSTCFSVMSMTEHPIKVEEPDVGFSSMNDHCNSLFVRIPTPQTPKTPTVYGPLVGSKPASAMSTHRTPRTPYTPSTPSRAGHFTFPAITEGAVVTYQHPHRYQKSTVFHPYGGSQSQQCLSPASPHFINQRHIANQAQQQLIDQQKFRQDVAQAQHEIEQHLQQLQQEDRMKHQQQQQQQQQRMFQNMSVDNQFYTATNTNSAMKFQQSSTAEAGHFVNFDQPVSPVSDVLELLMQEQNVSDHSNVRSVAGEASGMAVSDNSQQANGRTSFSHEPVAVPSAATDFPELLCDAVDIKKARRKQKPEPLVIPPDASNFACDVINVSWEQSRHLEPVHHHDTKLSVYGSMMNSARVEAPGRQWIRRDVCAISEPHSAPPFPWSATTSFSTFDADSVLADLPP